jgi:hypothetical protein
MRLIVTALVFCSVLVLFSTGESATPAVDASLDTVQCDTVILTITAKPAFMYGGTPTPVQLSLKGTVDGCSVAGPSPVTILPGSKVSGKLTLPSSDCNALIGTIPISGGSLTIKWKTSERLVNRTSVGTPTAFTTGFFSAPWGGSYIQGQFGGATTVTGSFAGTDGGSGSSAMVLVSEDFGTLNAGCASSAGVKVIHAALGQLNLR